MKGLLERVERLARRHVARTRDEVLAILIAHRLADLANVGRYLWAADRLGEQGLLRHYRSALTAENGERAQAFWASFEEAHE